MIVALRDTSESLWPSIKKGLILTAKMALVAAVALTFFSLFCRMLNPMMTLAFSEKILWRIGSIPVVMWGISAGVTAFATPILGMNIFSDAELNSPMFQLTENNLVDCFCLITKAVTLFGLIFTAGMVASVVITFFIPNPF